MASHQPIRMVWEGSQYLTHSLAIINRELCTGLIERGFEMSLKLFEAHEHGADFEPRFAALEAYFEKPLSGPADIHLRHMWPPNFEAPSNGRWVMIQPWEFGSIPQAWLRPLQEEVDELWVPTQYVKQCYVDDGVPADIVQVIPNGVDVDRFHPGAKPLVLQTRKSFRFLFVGGTIARKGIDLLLETYCQQFSAADDVCLVIKDMGGDSVYRHSNARDKILALQADPKNPEIEYLQGRVPHDEIAGLYTACDALVHPYHGEGFGMPIAEAMACGLPVVVTGLGAALDFCDANNSYLIPATKKYFSDKKVGDMVTVHEPWLAMPDAETFGRLMRFAVDHPEDRQAKAKAARARIVREFQWSRVIDLVAERLQVVARQEIKRDVKDKEMDSNNQAQDILAPAIGAFQEGRFQEAEQAFRGILGEYPELAAAHSGLGAVLSHQGRIEEALVSLKRAVECLPEVGVFHDHLGVALYQLGRFDEAAESFDKAIAIDAEDLDAWINLGQVNRKRGLHDKAAECALGALNLAPQSLVALELFARVSLDIEYHDGVDKALACIKALEPNHPLLSEVELKKNLV